MPGFFYVWLWSSQIFLEEILKKQWPPEGPNHILPKRDIRPLWGRCHALKQVLKLFGPSGTILKKKPLNLGAFIMPILGYNVFFNGK